jgi:hypothetical protein
VQPVNYTLEELRADQIVASQAAETVQVLATTAVEIVNNRVELIVGNPGLFYTDLDQAGIELPESVVVLASDPDGELPDTNRGVMLEAIISDDRLIYLPVQPPSGSSMAALMEGTLVEVDGCLRIEDDHYADGWLVLWPFGSDIRVDNDRIEVINRNGQPVARVGERLRAGGGAVESTRRPGCRWHPSAWPARGCAVEVGYSFVILIDSYVPSILAFWAWNSSSVSTPWSLRALSLEAAYISSGHLLSQVSGICG